MTYSTLTIDGTEVTIKVFPQGAALFIDGEGKGRLALSDMRSIIADLERAIAHVEGGP